MPDRIDTWAREMSLKVMGSESRSVTIDLVRGGSGASGSSSISPPTDVPAVEKVDVDVPGHSRIREALVTTRSNLVDDSILIEKQQP